MKAKKDLFRYLYLALIEIRHDANEREDKKTYALTNLLHTLPLNLAKEEVNYESLLEDLLKKASSDKNLVTWMQNNKNKE